MRGQPEEFFIDNHKDLNIKLSERSEDLCISFGANKKDKNNQPPRYIMLKPDAAEKLANVLYEWVDGRRFEDLDPKTGLPFEQTLKDNSNKSAEPEEGK